MHACTFFGHRDCPDTVKPELRSVIEELIVQHGVDTFYVGNNGRFDAYVRDVLRSMRSAYPHIRYAVVLSHLPTEVREYEDHLDTMLPEGVENTPPRFAIEYRNRWLLRNSEYVICYVRNTWGGAYKFTKKAGKQGKHVINLCEAGPALPGISERGTT